MIIIKIDVIISGKITVFFGESRCQTVDFEFNIEHSMIYTLTLHSTLYSFHFHFHLLQYHVGVLFCCYREMCMSAWPLWKITIIISAKNDKCLYQRRLFSRCYCRCFDMSIITIDYIYRFRVFMKRSILLLR